MLCFLIFFVRRKFRLIVLSFFAGHTTYKIFSFNEPILNISSVNTFVIVKTESISHSLFLRDFALSYLLDERLNAFVKERLKLFTLEFLEMFLHLGKLFRAIIVPLLDVKVLAHLLA